MFFFDSFRLDIANATLQRGKQAIVLAPKAFNVLRYLVEHAGQLVTKEDLWQTVWSEVSVTDAALTVCMSEIRKALRDDAKKPRYLETVHRLGYRFIAPVSIEPARVADFGVSAREFGRVRGLSSLDSHFVGRQAELGELHKWWEQALAGERQIVFVTGEPGIGKTTLVEQFLRQEQVAHDNGLWLGRGQCIEHYGAGEAYLPLLDTLGRLCRKVGGGRLVELLDEHAPSWLVHMSSLVGAAQRRKLRRKVAGATHARMLRELAEAMEVITAERPLVLRLEDLHWSDYSTLEWLGFLARRSESARLLVLGTYRPVEVIVREHPLRNLKQELQMHGQCQELPLALLSEAAVTDYLNLRFGSRLTCNLPSVSRETGPARGPLRKLAHTIYQRTEGNPLFMVNLVDYLAEKTILKVVGDSVTVDSSEMEETDRIDTPPSIVEMIERNLGRLTPDEQAVLEAASVAGTQFPAAAVAAALGRSLSEVEACCAKLSRQHQFIHSCGAREWPDGTFAACFDFQHALYREALYKRITPGRRIELHERIAAREEAAYGEQAQEVAAELAYHYGLCGNKAKTLNYLEIAGHQSEKRSAYVESVAHFTAALELLKKLPENEACMRQELAVRIALARSLTVARGLGGSEAARNLIRADELAKVLGDRDALPVVWLGLMTHYSLQLKLRASREIGEQACALAGGAIELLEPVHGALGMILMLMGDFAEARVHFEHALMGRDLSECDFTGPFNETNPYPLFVPMTLWGLGYSDQAREWSQRGLAVAAKLSRPPGLATAHCLAAMLCMFLRDPVGVEEHTNAAITIATEYAVPFSLALATIMRGWALGMQGCLDRGLAEMREAIASAQSVGYTQRPRWFPFLAELEARSRGPEEGLKTLSEGLTLLGSTEERF